MQIQYKDAKYKGRVLHVTGLKAGRVMEIELRYTGPSNSCDGVVLDNEVIPAILGKFGGDPHPLRKGRRFNKSTPITVIIGDGLDASVDGRGYDHRHHKATVIANLSPRMLKCLREIMKAIDAGYGRNLFQKRQRKHLVEARTLLGMLSNQ